MSTSPQPQGEGRRRLVAAGLAVLLIGFIAFFLTSEFNTHSQSSAPDAGTAAQLPPHLRTPAQQRLPNGLVNEEEPEDFNLHGQLVGADGGGVAGVEVEAINELNGGVFAGLPCACAVLEDRRVDEDGKVDEDDDPACDPLSGCSCAADDALLDFLSREPSVPVAARTRSGPDGTFTIALDGGSDRFTVRAQVPGASATRINLHPGTRDIWLKLWPSKPTTFTVVGTVEDAQGRGIPGAPVLHLTDSDAAAQRAVTDSKGFFRFERATETGRLFTAVRGLPPQFQYSNDDEEPVRLKLSKAQLVRGRVVRDGAPAIGVTVQVDSPCAKEVLSDGAGRFSVVLPPGSTFFTVQDAPWNGNASVDVVADELPTEVEIILTRASRLEGEVVDTRGRPIAKALVSWTDPQPPRHGFIMQIRAPPTRLTDALGRFTIESDPAASWEVFVRAEGFLATTREVTLDEGQVATERFELQDAALFAGVVVDPNGKPLGNADLRVLDCTEGNTGCEFSAFGATGADGTFSRASLPAGPTQLLVDHSRFRSQQVKTTLPEPSLRVTLREKATLTGSVLDSQGKPLAARVRLQGPLAPNDFWPTNRVLLESSGAFSIPLRGEGKYRLIAIASDPTEQATVAAARADFELREVAPGPVALRLSATPSIRGFVRDHKGAGTSALVQAVLDEPSNPSMQRLLRFLAIAETADHPHTQAAKDGSFELRGLPPGRFQLWAVVRGLTESASAFAEPGASGVVLQLQPPKMD